MSRKVDVVKVLAQYMRKVAKFDLVLKDVKCIPVSNGKCNAEFAITKDHVNTEGNLHTGLMMTVVDVVSSWALLSYENGCSGVSSNIHLSYMKSVIPGEVLSIRAEVCEIIHPLAFLEVELSKKHSNEIVARGQQTLFISPSNPYSTLLPCK